MAKVNKHGLIIKGLKDTAGSTRHTSIGHLYGRYIAVFYDTEAGQLLRHLHSTGDVTRYKDDCIIYVAGYGGPVTMQQIADDVKSAVTNKYGAEW